MSNSITFWLKYKTPYKEIERWIAYRTYDKYNKIDTGLKPGYYESDTLMLHGMMQLMQDYVEIESAHWVLYDEYREMSWFGKVKYDLKYMFNVERSARAGLQALDNMQINMFAGDYPAEAGSDQWLKDLKEVYLWWTNVRPNRPDADDVTGLSAAFDIALDKETDKYLSPTESLKRYSDRLNMIPIELVLKSEEIELQYEKEDTDMLIKLIKIRNYLWT